jgi:CRP-like cAMP-binding protein
MGEGREELIRALELFPVLKRLSEDELRTLAAVFREERFPAGQEILKEGSEGSEMYLLLEGNVEVLKRTPFGESYVTAELKDVYRCSFGEMALIDRDVRSATVRAKTDCRTVSLSSEDFHRLCAEHPKIGLGLLFSVSATLVRNLRKENENLRLVYGALIEEIENG